MAEFDLDLLVLNLLYNTNQGLRLKDIRDTLYPTVKNQDKFVTKPILRQRIIRRLSKALDSGLIEKTKTSHKNRRYSIKDREWAQLILAANAIGLNLSKEIKPLELPTVLKGKTYEGVVQKVSKILLDIILQREHFLVQSQTSPPKPIIFDVSIQIRQEKSNKAKRDKILIIAPDEKSSPKIRAFTKEHYKDFLQYLTTAWMSYFDERARTHNNIVIAPLSDQWTDRLGEIIASGQAENLHDVIILATSTYLDTRNKRKKNYLIKSGPMTKMAVDRGDYKNVGEVIEHAIKEFEKELAKKYERKY